MTLSVAAREARILGAVSRLKAKPRNASYRPPLTDYACPCGYRTQAITHAWVHAQTAHPT